MSGKPFVFVIGSDGKPLMPCTGKRARLLLTRKRARVYRYQPFTIQLFDRSQDNCELQDVIVKLDPGSKKTGICVARIDEQHNLSVVRLIELEHRGQAIKMALQTRAAYRRNRRNRNTRYRPVRFLNRTKPKGWLAPSLMHRVNSTLTWVKRLICWLPVTKLAVERVRFDMQRLQNPEISSIEYQQGTLQGYEVREYLLEKFNRCCGYCGTDKVTRFEIDHFYPKSKGGSNRISNLVLSCYTCNGKKSNTLPEVFLADNPALFNKLHRQLKTPLHDAAAVNATRNRLFSELLTFGLSVETGTGGQTKYNRLRLHIPKTHALDAACVGYVNSVANWQRKHLNVQCRARGAYSRTITDKYGFPKAYSRRNKHIHGFRTGDIVHCTQGRQPQNRQSFVGRLVTRATGYFTLDLGYPTRLLKSVVWYTCKLLQRFDGYSYSEKKYEASSFRLGSSST